MARSNPTSLIEQFDRMIDEAFDDLLISRWNCGVIRGGVEQVGILEYPDRYEVTLAAPNADPADVDVELHATRLVVRIPGADGAVRDSTFNLAAAIDRERTEARWSSGVLKVVMPKQKPRRVELKSD